MIEIMGAIVEVINSYLFWAIVIISGLIILLTEILKLTKLTSSTKDDLIIMGIIKELKDLKNKIKEFMKKLFEFYSLGK